MNLPTVLRIPESERPQVVRFAVTFAVVIVTWACLHDVYLIGIEPRHFTEYHRPLLPIHHHALLAMQYAMVATFGPGLAFGFLAWFTCRAGARTPRRLRPTLGGFIVLIGGVEMVLVALGHYAAHRASVGLAPLYPRFLYPETTIGILRTQTINLTAYWLAPTCGAFYLLVLLQTRRRAQALAPAYPL